jgi:hypothetical protein
MFFMLVRAWVLALMKSLSGIPSHRPGVASWKRSSSWLEVGKAGIESQARPGVWKEVIMGRRTASSALAAPCEQDKEGKGHAMAAIFPRAATGRKIFHFTLCEALAEGGWGGVFAHYRWADGCCV